MRNATPLAVAAILVAGAAFAHTAATGVVKERMDLMGVLDRAMKELVPMVRADGPVDAARLGELAATIRDHAGDAITARFPEDSIHGPSEALPAIWTDWRGFGAKSENLRMLGDALATAAANGPAEKVEGASYPVAGFETVTFEQAVGLPPSVLVAHISATCDGCHLGYRKD